MNIDKSDNIARNSELKEASKSSPSAVPRMYGDVPPFIAVLHVPSLGGAKAEIVVVGMPYDGKATFRGGATRRAPQEIRKYSLL